MGSGHSRDATKRRRTGHPPGWVPLNEAARRTGLHENALRLRVNAGEFTKLRRTTAKNAALFVPEEEVLAFERGGIDAVAIVREARLTPVAAGA